MHRFCISEGLELLIACCRMREEPRVHAVQLSEVVWQVQSGQEGKARRPKISNRFMITLICIWIFALFIKSLFNLAMCLHLMPFVAEGDRLVDPVTLACTLIPVSSLLSPFKTLSKLMFLRSCNCCLSICIATAVCWFEYCFLHAQLADSSANSQLL